MEQIMNSSQTNWNNILIPEEQKFEPQNKSWIRERLIRTTYLFLMNKYLDKKEQNFSD
jgi:hypothetical protein